MHNYNISKEFEVFVQVVSGNDKNLTGEQAVKNMVKNSAVGKIIWQRHESDKDIKVNKFICPSFDNQNINIQVIEPYDLGDEAPVLMYYHGGAFVAPALEYHKRLVREYAIGTRCKVIYVDYRLAFEYAFPIGLEDCYCALKWVIENAQTLNINTNKIAVAGDSSGALLAIGVSQMVRNRLNKKICFQMLCYPVIDSEIQTESIKTFVDTPIWNASMNKYMWEIYLREGIRSVREEAEDMLSYVRPLKNTNFKDLPATYIELTEYDPVRDEGKMYGELLKNNGIQVEINETKGTIHGFDAVKNSSITQESVKKRIEALKKALY